MRREAPLGEDPEPSILIHSLFARRPAHVLCMSPRRGIIQYKPHYPIYRIITMKSICQSKILQKNLTKEHLEACFDAASQ